MLTPTTTYLIYCKSKKQFVEKFKAEHIVGTLGTIVV